MSVPAYRRKDSELKVLIKAEQIFREVIRLSKDEKVIPKRYHFIVAKNILENSRNLLYMITNANNTDLFSDIFQRSQFQTKAFYYLNCLEADVKFNIEYIRNIPSKYQNLISYMAEERELIRKWKKSDDNRICEFKEKKEEEKQSR